MKKYWSLLWGLTLTAALVAVIASFVHISGRTMLDTGLGVLSLYWLLIITTVPWNLYFRARDVRREIGVSRTRGIEVSAEREADVRRLERRLLWFAFVGHVVTAGIVAAVSYFSRHELGYYAAAFYLLSCAIRPAAAYLGYVRARIANLLRETKFPREDVVDLGERFRQLSGLVDALKDGLEESQKRSTQHLGALSGDLRATETRLREDVRLARESMETDRGTDRGRLVALEQRVAAVTRHFDSAVDGLTDQQELLSGIRAFVRLVRTDAEA